MDPCGLDPLETSMASTHMVPSGVDPLDPYGVEPLVSFGSLWLGPLATSMASTPLAPFGLEPLDPYGVVPFRPLWILVVWSH